MRPRRTGNLVAVAVVLAFAAAACGGEPPPPPAPPAPTPAPVATGVTPFPGPSIPGQSLDRAAMDLTVKPGADFFLYANGGWYAKAEIPADRGSTGVWLRLTEEIEKRTTQLLEEAA